MRALRLDPELAEAHAALAMFRYLFELDWYSAGLHFRRAIELDPSYAIGRQWYAMYLVSTGRLDEAVAQAEAAIRLDPLSTQTRANAARTFYLARLFDRAVEQYEQMSRIDPSLQASPESYTSDIRLARDRTPEALAEYRASHAEYCAEASDEKAEGVAGRSCCTYASAVLFAAMGDLDPAFHLLDRARKDGVSKIVDVAVEPLFDSLRGDPRYDRLLEELDLNG